MSDLRLIDVLVVGGGQSGLAVGYHLRRLRGPSVAACGTARGAPSFAILDDRTSPGGAWSHGWPNLRLFSPAASSSLPGWPMPPRTEDDDPPPAAHVVAYLDAYEQRYSLPVMRPVGVREVVDDDREDHRLTVHTTRETWAARVVVNTTGTWSRPFWPHLPGMKDFAGLQLHTVDYRGAAELVGHRVLVVGGGNSAAQVAADLIDRTSIVWAARRTPRYLPDDVDGRVLFQIATSAVRDHGRPGGAGAGTGIASLGDVVAVPAVRRARDELGLHAVDLPERLTPTGAVWADGHEEPFDAVVWCTGFRPALRHLEPLGLDRTQGHPVTDAGERSSLQSASDPRVLLVGYGDWCGPASATLIGVNRAARDAVSDAGRLLGLSLR